MTSAYEHLDKLTALVCAFSKPDPCACACDHCGRRDGLDAAVTDEMWTAITGRTDGGGTLCLWCLDRLAQERGVTGTVALHFCGRALYGGTEVRAG